MEDFGGGGGVGPLTIEQECVRILGTIGGDALGLISYMLENSQLLLFEWGSSQKP